MKATNSLNSHHGESRNRRADKMGNSKFLREMSQIGRKAYKEFYNRKRRQFLKNITTEKV